jgi:hypothetical protein
VRIFLFAMYALPLGFGCGGGGEEKPAVDADADADVDADADADADADSDVDDTGSQADPLADNDEDGVVAADDCDDDDAALGNVAYDADCDGYLTVNDCDDDDASINPGATDGLLTDRDCVDGLSEYSLALSDYGILGENPDDHAASSVSSAGDVDGDGLDDILVGASKNDEAGWDAGKAYLILGASLSNSSEISLSLADYFFVGEDSDDEAGSSVSSAGDVDGDGLDDLIIGAPATDIFGGGAAGKAYLILGATLLGRSSRTLNLFLADQIFVGENSGDNAGISVSSAGDVDGDGLDDLIVGAVANDDGGDAAGKAYLILGSSLGGSREFSLSLADHIFVGEEEGDFAGHSVSGVGDVDGDGLDDLLIGASKSSDGGTNSGKAYLILGSSLGTTQEIDLSAADYAFVGESAWDRAGYSVSGAGDVDGDGNADLLVGAPLYSGVGVNEGAVYIILGSSLGGISEIDLSDADYALTGDSSGLLAGISVSSAGDVDDDGRDDILVGATGEDSFYEGIAYLIMGASLDSGSGLDVYPFLGEHQGDNAGISVSSAGDVNGDGRDDILVGANDNDDVGGDGQGGKAYLILSGL